MRKTFETNSPAPLEKRKFTEAVEQVRSLSELFSDIKSFNKTYGGEGIAIVISDALRAQALQKQRDGLAPTEETAPESEESEDQIVRRFEQEKVITKNTAALKRFGLSLVRNSGPDAYLFYPNGIMAVVSDPASCVNTLQSLSVLKGDEQLARTIDTLAGDLDEQITQMMTENNESPEILNHLEELTKAFGNLLPTEDRTRRDFETYAKFNRVGQLKNYFTAREEANFLFERVGNGLTIVDHIMQGRVESAYTESEFELALSIAEREKQAGATDLAESIKSDLLENIVAASTYIESSKMDPDKQKQYEQILLKYTKILVDKRSLN